MIEIKKFHKEDRNDDDSENEPLMSEKDCNFQTGDDADDTNVDSDFDSIGEDDKDDEVSSSDEQQEDGVVDPPMEDFVGYDHRAERLIRGVSLQEYKSIMDGRIASTEPHMNNVGLYEEPMRARSLYGVSNQHLMAPSQREFNMHGGVASYTAPPVASHQSYTEHIPQNIASLQQPSRHSNEQIISSVDPYPNPPRVLSNAGRPSQMSVREARRYVNGDVFYTEPTADLELDMRPPYGMVALQSQQAVADMDFSRHPFVQTNNYPTIAPAAPPIPQELVDNELSFTQAMSNRELISRPSAPRVENYVSTYTSPAPPAPPFPQETIPQYAEQLSHIPYSSGHSLRNNSIYSPEVPPMSIGIASSQVGPINSTKGFVSAHSNADLYSRAQPSIPMPPPVPNNISMFSPQGPSVMTSVEPLSYVPPRQSAQTFGTSAIAPHVPPAPPIPSQYVLSYSVQDPLAQNFIQEPVSNVHPHISAQSLRYSATLSHGIPPPPPIPSEAIQHDPPSPFREQRGRNNVETVPLTPPRSLGQSSRNTPVISPETPPIPISYIQRSVTVSPIPPAPPIPTSI